MIDMFDKEYVTETATESGSAISDSSLDSLTEAATATIDRGVDEALETTGDGRPTKLVLRLRLEK